MASAYSIYPPAYRPVFGDFEFLGNAQKQINAENRRPIGEWNSWALDLIDLIDLFDLIDLIDLVDLIDLIDLSDLIDLIDLLI